MASLWKASLLGLGLYAPLLVSAVYEDTLVSQRLSKRFIDAEGHYNMSFYHVNDVHAHLDQFAASGGDCKDISKGCFGGYARIKSVVDATRPSHPDSLLLNIGDEFQGTLFFSYYGGEKIAQTLNQLGFNLMTVGNHEFDRGSQFLGEFLQNLTFPIVSANIVSSNEILNKTIKAWHYFEKYDLAVIGVTTPVTKASSSPGKETDFTDPVVAVQNTIDLIRSTTNIKRIAAITHIGYEEDQRLARETTGLYLIMGGHSHTLILPENDPDFSKAAGKYPTIVKNKEGDEVFIVTAYRWGEYIGYIDVTYDADGKVLAYHGAPVHLTNTVEQDSALQKQILEWRKPFEAYAAEVIGYTNAELDQTKCQKEECSLGDALADAMLEYARNTTKDAAFALMNAGGVRASIEQGLIERGKVLSAFPFGNAVAEFMLTGQRIWDTLEGVVAKVNVANGKPVTGFFQTSANVQVEYDPNGPSGKKLVSVKVEDKDLDMAAQYRVVSSDFVASGGDNILSPPAGDATTLDTLDEVLVRYLGEHNPLDVKVGGRIKPCPPKDGQAQQ